MGGIDAREYERQFDEMFERAIVDASDWLPDMLELGIRWGSDEESYGFLHITDSAIHTEEELCSLLATMTVNEINDYLRGHWSFPVDYFEDFVDYDSFDKESYKTAVLSSGAYDELVKGYAGTGNEEDDWDEFLFDAENDYCDNQNVLKENVVAYAEEQWSEVYDRIMKETAEKIYKLLHS